jgi:DNA-binding NarL/FixJ family response regulator
VRVVIGEDLFLLREGLVKLLSAHGFEIITEKAVSEHAAGIFAKLDLDP